MKKIKNQISIYELRQYGKTDRFNIFENYRCPDCKSKLGMIKEGLKFTAFCENISCKKHTPFVTFKTFEEAADMAYRIFPPVDLSIEKKEQYPLINHYRELEANKNMTSHLRKERLMRLRALRNAIDSKVNPDSSSNG